MTGKPVMAENAPSRRVGRSTITSPSVGPRTGAACTLSGVPRARLAGRALETRSESTPENTPCVSELLQGTPEFPMLIASEYHMFRVHRCFQKVGLGFA
jgi:uncharacterized SAM-binding protein YcdF (DUF218 family)